MGKLIENLVANAWLAGGTKGALMNLSSEGEENQSEITVKRLNGWWGPGVKAPSSITQTPKPGACLNSPGLFYSHPISSVY